MIEIKAGGELDQAIAEAIGVKVRRVSEYFRWYRTDNLKLFSPSTDLNAAFVAATEVGLFDDANVTLSRGEEGQWEIERHLGLRDGDTLAIQPTPALAICAAILKL